MTGWATSETVLAGQVEFRSVELHAAKDVHFADVSDSDFATLADELERVPELGFLGVS